MDWSAIQVKIGKNSTEEILGVIRHEKGERIFDICWNVRLTHGSVCTIHVITDRIK